MVFFRVNIKKIIRLEKIDSIGHRMHVLCSFEVQIFTTTPLKSLFVKLRMAVDFYSSIFWERFFVKTCLFWDLCGTSNIFDRFDFCFFLIILLYIWLKIDKRKTISPMAVLDIFSCRYQKNNQVGKKLARSDIGCTFYVRLKFKFS